MKRYYITFSGSAYDATTQVIVDRATAMGADELRVYDDKWLTEQPFWTLNKWLWDIPDDHGHLGRGFLWFCWKPFIIMDALSRCADGDIVLFADADTYPIADFSVLYEECERNGGTMLFNALGCSNANYTKRDCNIVMGLDNDAIHQAQHAVCRFMLFQKGPWIVQQFLAEWLAYCLNPIATTFRPSTLASEYPELIQHRTEQSIFTNLAHKYGLRLYREACQFGGTHPQDQDLYPQLFEQRGTIFAKNLNGSRFRNV